VCVSNGSLLSSPSACRDFFGSRQMAVSVLSRRYLGLYRPLYACKNAVQVFWTVDPVRHRQAIERFHQRINVDETLELASAMGTPLPRPLAVYSKQSYVNPLPLYKAYLGHLASTGNSVNDKSSGSHGRNKIGAPWTFVLLRDALEVSPELRHLDHVLDQLAIV